MRFYNFICSTNMWIFLESQLFYSKIDVTHSLTTSHLALSTISSSFLHRFGRSLQFATQNLIGKLFLIVRGVKMAGFGGGFKF